MKESFCRGLECGPDDTAALSASFEFFGQHTRRESLPFWYCQCKELRISIKNWKLVWKWGGNNCLQPNIADDPFHRSKFLFWMVLQLHTIATWRPLEIIEDLMPPFLCAISHFYVLLDPTPVSHLLETPIHTILPQRPNKCICMPIPLQVNPA